jgi:ubiquinol-cytochrome c reductase cytochrome b subunit
MDPINFDPANPMKTPPHIYPEWYFLWSYEVLRGFFFDIAGIPAMKIGLAAFGIANGIFFLMPWLDRSDVVAPAHKRGVFKIWFWLLIVDMVVLTIWGKLPPTGANAWVGFFASITFLLLLLVLLPLITKIEAKKAGGVA